NVAFELKIGRLPKAFIDERSNLYLKKTGLERFASLYPKELSGGMKQRVSITPAVENDRVVLLMDEPLGRLEEQNRFILQEDWRSIWAETKKTVLFITHSIDEALLLSDRILLMGAQPGEIIDEIIIDKPRPRKIEDIRKDPEMAAKFIEIWHHLQEE